MLAVSPTSPAGDGLKRLKRGYRSQEGWREGEGLPRFFPPRRSASTNPLRTITWGMKLVPRRSTEMGRNAIERQGGRCYTPAALKVAAVLPLSP
jgi:hypothetical protein